MEARLIITSDGIQREVDQGNLLETCRSPYRGIRHRT